MENTFDHYRSTLKTMLKNRLERCSSRERSTFSNGKYFKGRGGKSKKRIEQRNRARFPTLRAEERERGREGHPRENKGYEREREGFRARTLLENEDLDYARVEWNVPRGAKTSTPVVVGKGIPKLLPSLKIVVDDEDGRFRGRKLVEREGRERDRRGDNASSSIETPVLSLLSSLSPPSFSLSLSPRGNWPSFSFERGKGRENAFRHQRCFRTSFFFLLSSWREVGFSVSFSKKKSLL